MCRGPCEVWLGDTDRNCPQRSPSWCGRQTHGSSLCRDTVNTEGRHPAALGLSRDRLREERGAPADPEGGTRLRNGNSTRGTGAPYSKPKRFRSTDDRGTDEARGTGLVRRCGWRLGGKPGRGSQQLLWAGAAGAGLELGADFRMNPCRAARVCA